MCYGSGLKLNSSRGIDMELKKCQNGSILTEKILHKINTADAPGPFPAVSAWPANNLSTSR
jgi:hypothetical protein